MKKFFYILLLFLVAGVLYGIYAFSKKPADTRDMTADFEISAENIVKAFTKDEELASRKYSDKILIVSGKVAEVDTSSFTVFLDALDPISSVTCNFYESESAGIASLKRGDLVRIKGKCTGRLIDVVLNNCSLISK